MLHTRYGVPAVLRSTARKDGVTLLAIRLSSSYATKERGVLNTPRQDTRSLAKTSPLSVMPLPMFLRSFLVATISSKKWLLLPSLRILDFFSKPHRTWIFNLEKNPILYAILKKSFYDQFCAGTTPAETRTCVKALKDLGFRGVILTYASEMVFDHKSGNDHSPGAAAEETKEEETGVKIDNVIESWRAGTVGTIDLIDEGDILAIKWVCQYSVKQSPTNIAVELLELGLRSLKLSMRENCHHSRCWMLLTILVRSARSATFRSLSTPSPSTIKKASIELPSR
jgi:hypothetical protein